MESNALLILKKIESCAPDMQREILDFIEFIEKKYNSKLHIQKKKTLLRKEPFIGMWKDRLDMKDSVEYVRTLRRNQSQRKSA